MAQTAELTTREGPRPDVSSVLAPEPTSPRDRSGAAMAEEPANASSGSGRVPGLVFLAGATVLSLVCGMIGACLALNLFENSTRATPGGRRTGQATSAPEVEALRARITELAKRTEVLKTTLEARPEAATADAVSALRGQVAELVKAESALTPLAGRMATLDTHLDRIATTIESLRADVSTLRSKVEKLDPKTEAASFTPLTAPSDPPPTVESPSSEPASPESATGAVPAPNSAATTPPQAAPIATRADDPEFARGVELFKKGRFAEASAVFNGLRERAPDDARVWYYAALSTGFAKNQWVQATERLVEKGLQRERAGTPDKSEIDSAFRHLTLNTGRDWLAAYRNRLKSR